MSNSGQVATYQFFSCSMIAVNVYVFIFLPPKPGSHGNDNRSAIRSKRTRFPSNTPACDLNNRKSKTLYNGGGEDRCAGAYALEFAARKRERATDPSAMQTMAPCTSTPTKWMAETSVRIKRPIKP